LKNPAWRLVRIGLEAGPLSQWLFSGLAEAGLPAICIETRHTKAFLKAQVNKTDRNDARGIAQMMRVNLFRPVHAKTLTSQKRRALLTARKLLQEKAIAIENDIRGLLRNFGLKVGIVATGGSTIASASLSAASASSWSLCWWRGKSCERHSWSSTASCYQSSEMTRPAEV
jgi:transposase